MITHVRDGRTQITRSSVQLTHYFLSTLKLTGRTGCLPSIGEDNQLLRMNQHYLKYSESYATEQPQQAPYVKQDFSDNVGHFVFLHLGETDINAKKPHATLTHCYVKKRDFSPARAQQFYSLRNMISGRR